MSRCRWLFVFLWGLVACQSTLPAPSATPPAAERLTAVVSTEGLASVTPTPELPVTAVSSPSVQATTPTKTAVPTYTPRPTRTPSATPTSPPLTPPPFQQDVAFNGGTLQRLWPVPPDGLWAVTEYGIFTNQTGAWKLLTPNVPVHLWPPDSQGRTWILFNEGGVIGTFTTEGQLVAYGPEQGWVSEYRDDEFSVYSDNVVVDRQNRVWVANGRHGLLRLDPTTNRWQNLSLEETGFAPPPLSDSPFFDYDPQLFYTDVALDTFGNVWVTACWVRRFHDGPQQVQIREGAGVRWFNGEQWEHAPETAGRCVYDIEVDAAAGTVWLGGWQHEGPDTAADLLRYTPQDGRWQRTPLPPDPRFEPLNQRYVEQMHLGADGRLWVIISRLGGASQLADALAYLTPDTVWQMPFPILDTPQHLQVTPAELWLAASTALTEADEALHGIIQYDEAGEIRPIGMFNEVIDPYSLTVDGRGRVWFRGAERDTLWYYAPSEEDD